MADDQRSSEVYDQVVGVAWGALPASIRAMHQAGESQGFMTVSWGDGLLARWLARILGFPRPAANLAVRLKVKPTADGLVWVRTMGPAVITTRQAVSRGLVIEALGSIVCAFRLLPDAAGLRYEQKYTAIRFRKRELRLPRWLSPRVSASVIATPAGPRTEVEIGAPLLGRVLRYEGIVEPTRSDRLP